MRPCEATRMRVASVSDVPVCFSAAVRSMSAALERAQTSSRSVTSSYARCFRALPAASRGRTVARSLRACRVGRIHLDGTSPRPPGPIRAQRCARHARSCLRDVAGTHKVGMLDRGVRTRHYWLVYVPVRGWPE